MSRDFNYMNELIEDLFNPFDFDRKFYKFNRAEKDMNPYSVYETKDKDAVIIVHNVLGLDKKDVKISTKNENGVTFIVINGKTVDSITEKEYSISSRFSVDTNALDITKAISTMNNGLLYITIPQKKKPALKEGFIAIQ